MLIIRAHKSLDAVLYKTLRMLAVFCILLKALAYKLFVGCVKPHMKEIWMILTRLVKKGTLQYLIFIFYKKIFLYMYFYIGKKI